MSSDLRRLYGSLRRWPCIEEINVKLIRYKTKVESLQLPVDLGMDGFYAIERFVQTEVRKRSLIYSISNQLPSCPNPILSTLKNHLLFPFQSTSSIINLSHAYDLITSIIISKSYHSIFFNLSFSPHVSRSRSSKH